MQIDPLISGITAANYMIYILGFSVLLYLKAIRWMGGNLVFSSRTMLAGAWLFEFGTLLYMAFWFPRWVLMAIRQPHLSIWFQNNTEWTYPAAAISTAGLVVILAETFNRHRISPTASYAVALGVCGVTWTAGLVAGL